jgi:hypothetical protein
MNSTHSNNVINRKINIKCLQINLQRSKAATAHLNKFIMENNIDLVLIQEPYVIKSKVCDFPVNYRTFYSENIVTPKTAIIVINNKIQVLFLQTYSNIYSTFIKLQLQNKNFLCFSILFATTKHKRTTFVY